ncbi:PAS domain S-box protein [Rufibacter sp. XAAS-G3-1]|uniref:PAS domain S-box protein n=1 Tax=Rufibacter sp. XAAS-G3-1 TaxID=2729134 RepID=UPI0015E71050|nr:PAS domain S-box protein [Rufibacter sp. XAAS-G3-1]
MHIQRSLFGVFLVAFLSLLFFSVVAYFNLKENEAIDRQEKVSFRVLKSVEVLFQNLQDIEEGATSFRATRQQAALLKYQEAFSQYPLRLRELQSAGVTDSVGQSQISAIAAQTEAFVQVASQLVSQVSTPSATSSSAPPKDQLRNQLSAIEILVHAVEKKERSRLHFADTEATVKTERTFSAFAAFSAFMFFFFMTTYWFISRTLTNKNKAATILREKEQLYSGLFYKSPVMLSLVDAETGRIMDTNERALAFFGHTREQVIGTTAESAGIFLDTSARAAMILQLGQDQKVQRFETQVKAKNEVKDVLYNIEKVVLGNRECLVVAFEDITDRKAAEKKQKESETLFSTIFYKSPIMKSISEAETGIYLDVNDNFTKFFGYEKEEIIGRTSTKLQL